MNETTLKAIKTLGLPTVLAVLLLSLVSWMIKDSATVARETAKENTAALVAAVEKLDERIEKLDAHLDRLGDQMDASVIELRALQERVTGIERGQTYLIRYKAQTDRAMNTNLNSLMDAVGAPAPAPLPAPPPKG